MTGTAFIFIITGENKKKVYCSEDSQAVPARPSGKGRLGTRLSVGK